MASSSAASASSSAGCSRAREPDPVDAAASRQLREPGPERIVGAQRVESLVRAGEDVLEDVLGLVRREPVALHGDRVHVAREPLDELAPGGLVARAAAGGEARVGLGGHAP